jgi:hypothetical protein
MSSPMKQIDAAIAKIDASMNAATHLSIEGAHPVALVVAREPVRLDWPTLDPSALHGLAGDIVRAIEPHSESDPAAILVQVLLAFGAHVGRGPHVAVEGDQHHGNLFALLVGNTSKGRKGTSWGRVRELFERMAARRIWFQE